MNVARLLFFAASIALPVGAFSDESNDLTEMGTQASYGEAKRLLLLAGEMGTVACRVYGYLMSGTIPRFSDNWTIESATRSYLRMRNLVAVRGVPVSSMVGPIDYFGN